MTISDERLREIANSPLSLAMGSYVDAHYMAKELLELRQRTADMARLHASVTELRGKMHLLRKVGCQSATLDEVIEQLDEALSPPPRQATVGGEAVSYTVVTDIECDGCYEITDGLVCSVRADKRGAVREARLRGWLIGRKGHYCPKCRKLWEDAKP